MLVYKFNVFHFKWQFIKVSSGNKVLRKHYKLCQIEGTYFIIFESVELKNVEFKSNAKQKGFQDHIFQKGLSVAYFCVCKNSGWEGMMRQRNVEVGNIEIDVQMETLM